MKIALASGKRGVGKTMIAVNLTAMLAETLRQLNLHFGVIINRADTGDARVDDYCRNEHIPVLLRVPDDRRIAAAYSRGELIIHTLPEYRPSFESLLLAYGLFSGTIWNFRNGNEWSAELSAPEKEHQTQGGIK